MFMSWFFCFYCNTVFTESMPKRTEKGYFEEIILLNGNGGGEITKQHTFSFKMKEFRLNETICFWKFIE